MADFVSHRTSGLGECPSDNKTTVVAPWIAASSDSSLKESLLVSSGTEIQKLMCGEHFDEIWTLTERPMVSRGDGGLDREAMLQSALSQINSDRREFDRDMTELLNLYVDSSMNEILTTHGLFDKLKFRYGLVKGIADSDSVLTLPRLAMSFPYETAIRVSRRLVEMQFNALSNNCLTPSTLMYGGKVGDLNPILAFPFSPLIIPSSWSKTMHQWTTWFYSFAQHRLGVAVPLILDDRIQKQIASMTSLAAKDEKLNVARMRCLGVVEKSTYG